MPTDVRVVVAYDGPARKVSGMNEGLSTDGVDRVRCIHPWCVTEHGATVHPDDEDHRSTGVALTVRGRRAEARGPGEETELELGALRRAGEFETWIVIETGIGASLALTRDGAQLLLRRLRDLIAPDGILGRDGDES
ncbi:MULTISPECIES: hypothetical protein [Microbacterium]|uniref:hypothetical protein n=1 Tax=Microbacterium TaxID=33882 RepID=UPI0006F556ED|nr:MULTISPECIES: hypothetical protein [Microbacterium]KQR21424.1 hypothetical protein ASF76_14335 [Microbacterium sp. Leaf151]MCI9857464.1 hypothetical protein [Microbacterium proteolyticum]